MENFEELLDQYMDEEQIKEKLSADVREEKREQKEKDNKKKIRNAFVITIPISDFVSDYLGTEHDCSNLKHRGLKSFKNPYVIGIPNEFAMKNPECVIRNEIVVVIDAYGNPGTYINPKLLKNIQNMEEYQNILRILKSTRIHNLGNVQALYNEYMAIITKIDELEQQYSNSCNLLSQLQRKSILREIRKYVKRAKKTQIEFTRTQKNMLEHLDVGHRLFCEVEDAVETDFSNEEDVSPETEDAWKSNRQKQFIQYAARGFKRKGD